MAIWDRNWCDHCVVRGFVMLLFVGAFSPLSLSAGEPRNHPVKQVALMNNVDRLQELEFSDRRAVLLARMKRNHILVLQSRCFDRELLSLVIDNGSTVDYVRLRDLSRFGDIFALYVLYRADAEEIIRSVSGSRRLACIFIAGPVSHQCFDSFSKLPNLQGLHLFDAIPDKDALSLINKCKALRHVVLMTEHQDKRAKSFVVEARQLLPNVVTNYVSYVENLKWLDRTSRSLAPERLKDALVPTAALKDSVSVSSGPFGFQLAINVNEWTTLSTDSLEYRKLQRLQSAGIRSLQLSGDAKPDDHASTQDNILAQTALVNIATACYGDSSDVASPVLTILHQPRVLSLEKFDVNDDLAWGLRSCSCDVIVMRDCQVSKEALELLVETCGADLIFDANSTYPKNAIRQLAKERSRRNNLYVIDLSSEN